MLPGKIWPWWTDQNLAKITIRLWQVTSDATKQDLAMVTWPESCQDYDKLLVMLPGKIWPWWPDQNLAKIIIRFWQVTSDATRQDLAMVTWPESCQDYDKSLVILPGKIWPWWPDQNLAKIIIRFWQVTSDATRQDLAMVTWPESCQDYHKVPTSH